MGSDLIPLWKARDALQEEWGVFLHEGQSMTQDPVLDALSTPVHYRTAQEQRVIEEHWERRTDLLEALYDIEHKIRVASGHESEE